MPEDFALNGGAGPISGVHDPGGKARWKLQPGVTGHAEFSDCGRYRYKLARIRELSAPAVLFCLMNPSTADAIAFDDPTVAKCQRIAGRLGYGRVFVGNACGYRATDNRRLLEVEDPVGPRNREAVLEMAAESAMVVVAHGRLPGGLQPHAEAMCRLLQAAGHPLHVLRLTPDQVPMHPLARGKNFISESVKPTPWQFAERE